MKMSRVFLVLGFALIMALYSDAMPFGIAHIARPCCFDFDKIPLENILEVKKTDARCPQQGFIVATPGYKYRCVREIKTN